MEQKDKQPPSIAPEDDSFSKNLALAIKDENIRRPFTVTMKIRGGIPSQGYILDFSASGDGTAECSFQCSLSDREGASQKANLDTKDLIELLRKVERIVKLPQEQPLFLPDTLVGIVEVSDGTYLRRFYFAADPEQAKRQGKVPAAELLQVVNAIYAVGAKLTGHRNVKP